MLMTEYETTVIMRPDLGGDAIEATLDKVRSVVDQSGGKLLAIEHWGRKKLAYEIAKGNRGVYVNTHYLGGNKLVAELERNLRISDNVLRYMTLRIARGVEAEEREVQEYVAPQYDAGDEAPAEEQAAPAPASTDEKLSAEPDQEAEAAPEASVKAEEE